MQPTQRPERNLRFERKEEGILVVRESGNHGRCASARMPSIKIARVYAKDPKRTIGCEIGDIENITRELRLCNRKITLGEVLRMAMIRDIASLVDEKHLPWVTLCHARVVRWARGMLEVEVPEALLCQFARSVHIAYTFKIVL